LPAIYLDTRIQPAGPVPSVEPSQEVLQMPAGRQVWEWLAARYPGQTLTLDTSPQLDLGVDSLEWLELTLELNDRLGVVLTEDAVARIATLRDLIREVAAASESAPREAGLKAGDALTPETARWLVPPGRMLAFIGTAMYAVNWLLMRLVFRLDVEGTDGLPRSGPIVFAPNHTSYLDPFAVGAALPFGLVRRAFWAGATTHLFDSAWKRFFSRVGHVFPVDPDRTAASSLAFGAATLERGWNLVWFPEGRRSPDGRLQWFMPGIGVLLERFRVPIVPVHVEGAFEALPMGRRWPRLVRISVVFGPPLDPVELMHRGSGENQQTRIANALHDAVAELATRR
jgi:long-chain acyl-CoA synthetase